MAAAASHVLLMPEDVQGQPPSTKPMYGSVISVDGPKASVRLLSQPQVTVQVASATLRSRRVSADEFEAGSPGMWLRQATVGKAEGKYVYGQVTAYSDGMATIRTAQGTVESHIDDLVEIAPVLCFLLSKFDSTVTALSEESLSEKHALMLDRLLGRNGQRPTRAIPRLLREVAPVRQHPNAKYTLQWTNKCLWKGFNGRRVPSAQQSNIGERFDQDPNHEHDVPPAGEIPDEDNNDGLEAMLDGIVSSSSGSRPLSQSRQAVVSQVQPTDRTQRFHSSSAQAADSTHHSKVLTAIADDLDLVRFYLTMCQPTGIKRAAPTAPEREPQLRRLASPGDLFGVPESSTRPSKHAFNPSSTQEAVNRLLVSLEHEGNTPSALIEAMISSRSTKFKHHPAIMTRGYDIAFGRRGLTIMHFVRFDFSARRAWYADGSVNLNNFSASVALPKATRPHTRDDVSNALTVLHLFAEEFFEQETRRLVSCAREFVEELRSFCKWSTQDVETLTFWIDSVLEEYRTATEHDARHGSSTRSNIKTKMSLQDPDLQSVLYVMQSERLASLSAAPTRRPVNDGSKAKDTYRRVDGTI